LPASPTSLNHLSTILNNSSKNERPISVFAGGSGSVTLLMEDMNTQTRFVRKYSPLRTSEVLVEQSKFLATFEHSSVIQVSNLKIGTTAASFDMPYLENYETFTDLLLTASYSRIELVTKRILDTHEVLFRKEHFPNELNSHWNDYLSNRTNPEKRLSPILHDYLIENPNSKHFIQSSIIRLQNFYEKLLINEKFTHLKVAARRTHGDFSASNIMVGLDSHVVFIDLVNHAEQSSLVNDFSKLYFSLLSGFDATFNLLRNSDFWNNSTKPLPNLANLNSLRALDILEKYIFSIGGEVFLREVKVLSFMQLIRVLPYRLAQDKQNLIRWLIWANDLTTTLASKIR
jgi:hypothetical protein